MNSTLRLHDGFSFRLPIMADAQDVLALMNACDVADYGEPDSDLDDFIFDWQEGDLQRDAWLIQAADGTLAAYGMVSAWSGGFQIDCFARPDVQEMGLQACLLNLGEQRAHALLAAGAATPPVVRAYAAHVNQSDLAALVAASFQPAKYHFRMQIDQAEPPPDPVWPDRCQLRTVRPGQDDESLHGLIQQAFDLPGRTPQPLEEWRDFMMRPDHFVPELWFVLTSNEEIVAAALCFDYEPYGWVRQLAVAADWRRRGIGSAMLHHVFGVFYRRGQRRVALGVEAANENAYRLYERAGMRRVRQFDEYQKRLA